MRPSEGVLPNRDWLRKNGFGGIVDAMKQRPDLFAHIPKEDEPKKSTKTPRKA